MIIGACGFGATGSSVVTDYLKEFDNVTVKDDLEFTYLTSLDGLLYLERAVMNPYNRTGDSIAAIRRFQEFVMRKKRIYEIHGLSSDVFLQSAKDFVDAITMTKWKWYCEEKEWRYSPKHLLRKYMEKKVIPARERKLGHRADCWPLTDVRLSVRPDNFYEAAQKHVDELLKGMGLDQNKVIALDQPFAGNNPQACFQFCKDPYAVVVNRDPRDLYVFGKTKLMGKMHFFPIDNVEDFIIYYRCLRKDQPYLQDHPRILRLRFEDMVYEYDKTTAKLQEFLHLPENPHPKSVFDPSLSIANTQVFKRYPQFADDVKKIEEALPDYLFDFSKYPEPDFRRKMFYGKSPKHDKFRKKYAEDGYVPKSK
jgi:hypothetical protein